MSRNKVIDQNGKVYRHLGDACADYLYEGQETRSAHRFLVLDFEVEDGSICNLELQYFPFYA